MLIKFSELHDKARIWIYQCNRDLSTTETADILQMGEQFATQWTAHEQELRSAFTIVYNRFLILAVDEGHNQASGCSIDKSIHFFETVEEKYKCDLFNRMLLAYKKGEKIFSVDINTIQNLDEDKRIENNDIVFNNLVETVSEWKMSWEIPFNRSWVYNRYKTAVS